jgi:hypothetical protein
MHRGSTRLPHNQVALHRHFQEMQCESETADWLVGVQTRNWHKRPRLQ